MLIFKRKKAFDKFKENSSSSYKKRSSKKDTKVTKNRVSS